MITNEKFVNIGYEICIASKTPESRSLFCGREFINDQQARFCSTNFCDVCC
jgi:hypothetical protein